MAQRLNPNCSGVISPTVTTSGVTSATQVGPVRVISSMPSCPWTTNARRPLTPRGEERLAAAGWTVVHPERMSVAEQVQVLASAVHVAGIEGSAFHTLLLLRGFSGTVDVLTRHDSPNFEVINRVQRLDLERHALVGGEARVWNRPNGSRDVGWTGVDVEATVDLVLSTCARHAG